MTQEHKKLNDLAAAPVAFFAFNRPEHTRRTLAALAANDLASKTDLYIFCDGARAEADTDKVADVRKHVRVISGFHNVFIVERECNFGLANSLVAGITQVLTNYDRIIVLEDDILVVPHFLQYMNQALKLYQVCPDVGAINGFNFPSVPPIAQSYFLPQSSSWGWGTWAERWKLYRYDADNLLKELAQKGLVKAFDLQGAYPYYAMLRQVSDGAVDSWAIRWYASLFLAGKLTLWPQVSLIQNIGFDGSGQHCQNMAKKIMELLKPNLAQEAFVLEQVDVVASIAGQEFHKNSLSCLISENDNCANAAEAWFADQTKQMTKNKQFPMTSEQAIEWLRKQPDQEALVKACYFDDPLLEAAKRFYQSEEWAETCKRLPVPPGRALDLGAGRGIASYALAMEGFAVTALEPDPSHLVGSSAIRSLAESSGLPIVVMEERGENLPFANHSFDLVYTRQVLHHVGSLPDLCKEAARVLKPGGIFIAAREHVVDRPEELPVFLKSHSLHNLHGEESAFSLPQYINAMDGAGFRFREILANFDNIINFSPLNTQKLEGQLRTLWRWPHEPSFAELVGNARQIDRTPGRLYTFVALKPDHAIPQKVPENLQHELIIQQVLNDVLQAGLDEANQRLGSLEARLVEQMEQLNALRCNLRHPFRWLFRKLTKKRCEVAYPTEANKITK